METESKLLNIEYIETKIKELEEIKLGHVAYKIEKSNRENSNSIYVRFYKTNLVKGETHFYAFNESLRISDHYLANSPSKQFIVEPDAILTKKKKETFVRTLKKEINLCFKRSLTSLLKNVKTK